MNVWMVEIVNEEEALPSMVGLYASREAAIVALDKEGDRDGQNWTWATKFDHEEARKNGEKVFERFTCDDAWVEAFVIEFEVGN